MIRCILIRSTIPRIRQLVQIANWTTLPRPGLTVLHEVQEEKHSRDNRHNENRATNSSTANEDHAADLPRMGADQSCRIHRAPPDSASVSYSRAAQYQTRPPAASNSSIVATRGDAAEVPPRGGSKARQTTSQGSKLQRIGICKIHKPVKYEYEEKLLPPWATAACSKSTNCTDLDKALAESRKAWNKYGCVFI